MTPRGRKAVARTLREWAAAHELGKAPRIDLSKMPLYLAARAHSHSFTVHVSERRIVESLTGKELATGLLLAAAVIEAGDSA
jgi:hypothetical protein